jgi:hypothetical protein
MLLRRRGSDRSRSPEWGPARWDRRRASGRGRVKDRRGTRDLQESASGRESVVVRLREVRSAPTQTVSPGDAAAARTRSRTFTVLNRSSAPTPLCAARGASTANPRARASFDERGIQAGGEPSGAGCQANCRRRWQAPVSGVPQVVEWQSVDFTLPRRWLTSVLRVRTSASRARISARSPCAASLRCRMGESSLGSARPQRASCCTT